MNYEYFMQNHDPGSHHGMLASTMFDIFKGKKSKKPLPFWIRLRNNIVRFIMIGLLMLSPFIFLALLLMVFMP